MARAISQRQTNFLTQAPPQEPQVVTLWESPKGVNVSDPQSRLTTDHAVALENVMLYQGRIRSRFGTSTYGASFTATPMLVVNFIKSTGGPSVIRFDTDKIWKWGGTTWTQFLGAGPFTGTTSDQWTFTAWNDTLIITNGVDGVYTLDVDAVTLTAIAAAPKARQLSTWAGRIIAVGTIEGGIEYGSRVRWSVKNSSTDWTGTGSGYEDVLSSPGGSVDASLGFMPITDRVAMLARTNSVWQVEQTGNADAPFAFNRLFAGIGCRARRSIVSVPDGIVFHGTDGVYHVTLSGWENIGLLTKSKFQAELLAPSISYAIYNPLRQVYVIAVAETSTSYCNAVWEYSFEQKGWTRSVYPFNIRSLGYTSYSASQTIDSLSGTIDSLVGIIDLLGEIESGQGGMFLVPADSTSYVVIADAQFTTDVSIGSNTVNLLATTGQIKVDSSLHRTQLIELQLEYEAAASQTLYFDYLESGSTSYTNFASAAITTTTAPTIIRVNKTLERQFLRLQVRSSTIGKLTIIAFHTAVEEGGLINS